MVYGWTFGRHGGTGRVGKYGHIAPFVICGVLKSGCNQTAVTGPGGSVIGSVAVALTQAKIKTSCGPVTTSLLDDQLHGYGLVTN